MKFEEWLSQQDGIIEVDCGCVTTEAFYHWMRVAYEAGSADAGPQSELVSHLSRICAESYQVVGALSEALNIFNDIGVIKALDNLSAQELIHNDVLPFSVPEAASPAPVVPEKCPAEIRDLMASHSDTLFNDDDAQEIWNSCRATMIQAGHSLEIPDGYVMVPKQPTEEMLAAAKEWTGLTNTAEVVYVKMLAAAPKEDKHG